MDMYDVLIIGAGPSGLACADTLVKQGKKCLVLERKVRIGRKVCGDGLTPRSIPFLLDLGILPEQLYSLGGKRIENVSFFFHDRIINREFDEKIYGGKYGIGISRDAFDRLLYEKYLCDGGIVEFSVEVKTIEKIGENFLVNGKYIATTIVIAAGAFNSFVKDKCSAKDMPIGFSSRIKGQCCLKNTSFYFEYDIKKYGKDGYGWIFPVGNDMWNVGCGVIADERKPYIKKMYYDFEKRILEYFISDITYDRKPQGALIGTAFIQENNDDFIYYVGDSKGAADLSTGEGISFALASGISTARKILAK